MRIFSEVAYKGTAYLGWQKQNDGNTIQNKIEEVLSKFFNCEISISGSGRTDAGVHALGQIFTFDIDGKEVDLDRLLYSANKMLPEDIKILSFKVVDSNFHARYSAKSKTYQYLIKRTNKDPFDYDEFDVEKEAFDLDLFKKALTYFIGEHNFMNFTSKEDDESGFIRTIYSIDVKEDKEVVTITLNGNGFMRYTIRYIIGTALEVSRNKMSIDELKALLDSDKPRHIMSAKAPACGLYLLKVIY